MAGPILCPLKPVRRARRGVFALKESSSDDLKAVLDTRQILELEKALTQRRPGAAALGD
jgi:hypothetical protein